MALGACVVERHITLDKNMYGSDQSASLEPDELAELMRNINILPQVFGTGAKIVSNEEKAIAEKLRYW